MINIQDIIPFMKDGWVAMDRAGTWCWFSDKPTRLNGLWVRNSTNHKYSCFECFDIAPADDWTKSLIKVGGK